MADSDVQVSRWYLIERMDVEACCLEDSEGWRVIKTISKLCLNSIPSETERRDLRMKVIAQGVEDLARARRHRLSEKAESSVGENGWAAS